MVLVTQGLVIILSQITLIRWSIKSCESQQSPGFANEVQLRYQGTYPIMFCQIHFLLTFICTDSVNSFLFSK